MRDVVLTALIADSSFPQTARTTSYVDHLLSLDPLPLIVRTRLKLMALLHTSSVYDLTKLREGVERLAELSLERAIIYGKVRYRKVSDADRAARAGSAGPRDVGDTARRFCVSRALLRAARRDHLSPLVDRTRQGARSADHIVASAGADEQVDVARPDEAPHRHLSQSSVRCNAALRS